MTTNKVGIGYWIFASIAFFWNLMGVGAYLSQAFLTEDMKATLPVEELQLIENTPAWVTAVFAIATFSGLLASVFLLLRKKWAVPTFLISLIAVWIQMGYSFMMTDASEIYGLFQGVIMPVLVIVIAFFLYRWSKTKAQTGILT